MVKSKALKINKYIKFICEERIWGVLTSQKLTSHVRTPRMLRWLLSPKPKGKKQNNFSFRVAAVKGQFMLRGREPQCASSQVFGAP